MNYFELFDIKPEFLIDKDDLRKRFYAKSKANHPDMFGLTSSEKQFNALEQSTVINKAFKVLNDDLERMRYLLEISGIEFAEGKETVPQEFLMEVMDINEIILDYKMSLASDDADDRLKEDISNKLSQLESNLLSNIDNILKNFNYQKADKKQLELIKDYYLKCKYLKRIESNLEN